MGPRHARDRGTKFDANASVRMRGLALTYRTGSDGLWIVLYEVGAAGTKIASKVQCNQLIC